MQPGFSVLISLLGKNVRTDAFRKKHDKTNFVDQRFHYNNERTIS